MENVDREQSVTNARQKRVSAGIRQPNPMHSTAIRQVASNDYAKGIPIHYYMVPNMPALAQLTFKLTCELQHPFRDGLTGQTGLM